MTLHSPIPPGGGPDVPPGNPPVDPSPWRPSAAPATPIFTRHGSAQVSYLPGHAEAEVQFAVRGWRPPCTAAEARDLIAALTEALADPLAPTYAAVRSAARLMEVRDDRAA
jgi:hypothetical protein